MGTRLRLQPDVRAPAHTHGRYRTLGIFLPSLPQDELTMDNISRSGLVNMCRYMGLPPFGNDNFLRYCLRSKLRAITQARFGWIETTWRCCETARPTILCDGIVGGAFAYRKSYVCRGHHVIRTAHTSVQRRFQRLNYLHSTSLHLSKILQDDQRILWEGVSSLTKQELQVS